MTYTASALAFMLGDKPVINKPIVIAGSEHAFDHPTSDAPNNARQALLVATSGVTISFAGATFSPTRTRKEPGGDNLYRESAAGPASAASKLPAATANKRLPSAGAEQQPVWIRPAPGLALPDITGPVLLEMYPSWTVPDTWVSGL